MDSDLLKRIATAIIIAMGMTAENQVRASSGHSMTYTYAPFYNLLVEYDLLPSSEDSE